MRILLVVSRWPWPPRRGDQMRTLQVAGVLAEQHQVTLLAPRPRREAGEEDEAAAAAPPPAPPFRIETYETRRRAAAGGLARAAVGGRPLQSGLFHQPGLTARLRELAPAADLAILQLVRLAAHADDLGATPFVADLIDSLALNFERRARFDFPWHRPLLALEARRLLAAEIGLLQRAAAGVVVCERDRAWLAARLPAAAAARLRVVPLEIAAAPETEVIEPAAPAEAAEPATGPATPPRLALTGNLGYFPTADAVSWWVRDVWPELRRARPELRLTLAGARPAPAVRRAARAPGVELVDSPPSLAPVLAAAQVALAPLRAGSGVPVKVLEAWSAGVPVVASPLGRRRRRRPARFRPPGGGDGRRMEPSGAAHPRRSRPRPSPRHRRPQPPRRGPLAGRPPPRPARGGGRILRLARVTRRYAAAADPVRSGERMC